MASKLEFQLLFGKTASRSVTVSAIVAIDRARNSVFRNWDGSAIPFPHGSKSVAPNPGANSVVLSHSATPEPLTTVRTVPYLRGRSRPPAVLPLRKSKTGLRRPGRPRQRPDESPAIVGLLAEPWRSSAAIRKAMAPAATPMPMVICWTMLAKVVAALIWAGGTSAKPSVLRLVNCIDRQRPPKNSIAIIIGVGMSGDKKAQANNESRS